MMRETASPASSVDGNVAKSVWVRAGVRITRTSASVTIPVIPSLPTMTPVRS